MIFGMSDKKPFLIAGGAIAFIVLMYLAMSYDSSPKSNQRSGTTTNATGEIRAAGDADTIEDTLQTVTTQYDDMDSRVSNIETTVTSINENMMLIRAQLENAKGMSPDEYEALLKKAETQLSEKYQNSSPDDVDVTRYPVNQSKAPQNDWLDTIESSFDGSGQTSSQSINPGSTAEQLFAAIDAVDEALGVTGPKTVKETVFGGSSPAKKSKEVTPVYTIPKNATIFDSSVATALVGRIPVNNNVSDPYRFKILTGPEAISSNSIYLPPELSAMTFSGTASGDWNLSCVRGQIDSVTFTFNDGEIVTVDSSNLGWISDEYGVPCIKGEKISNAGPVLAKRVMAGALTSGADTYARAQQDTVITGSGVAVDIEDANKYATYNALSGGARELERHFDKRMAQIFDAIYVANGTKVMIHIEDVIEINRDSNNRKVRYENEKNDYFAD